MYRRYAAVKYLGHGESALPGVTLNRSLFETVLRDLLIDGTERCVELYEETPRSGLSLPGVRLVTWTYGCHQLVF